MPKIRGKKCAKVGGKWGVPVAFLGLLMFAGSVRADAISNAVLNYPGGVWAAFTSEPFAGIPTPYSPTGSFNLTVTDPAEDEIDDPAGDEYLDSGFNPNCTFDLHINVSGGNV